MHASKHGLGRGLDALLPDAEETTQLPIDRIKTADQPRQVFAEKELTELAYSIRLHGILQPLVVAPDGDSYRLVAGERRLRASKMAGLSHVPVYVRSTEEQQHYELALVENIQRADLSAIEEAAAYAKLIADGNLTQEDLAKRLGKSRSAIANTLRLLNLPKSVQRALQEGQISAGHAQAILAQPAERREALFRAIVEQKLTVRQAEDWQAGGQAKPRPNREKPPWLRDFEQRLGAQVDLRGNSNKGKLVINYHSREELERLLERLS